MQTVIAQTRLMYISQYGSKSMVPRTSSNLCASKTQLLNIYNSLWTVKKESGLDSMQEICIKMWTLRPQMDFEGICERFNRISLTYSDNFKAVNTCISLILQAYETCVFQVTVSV